MSNNRKVVAMDIMEADLIPIPMWETPPHKITRALNDGKMHARNHYNNEEADPDWQFGVNSWAVNPYAECRPATFYSWRAGFCEEWANLKRAERTG